MLLKATNQIATPFDAEVARKLREDCDDVSTFTEGGSRYVMGFKNLNLKVYAVFRDQEQYESYLGVEPKNPYGDYYGRKPGW